MSHLVIDIGNTRTKLAIFKDRKLTHQNITEHLLPQDIHSYINQYAVQQSIISSVKDEIHALEQILESKTKYTRFSANWSAGVDIQYKTPLTLGLDRLAGVIGARSLYRDRNVLVIDAGTCITYDAISENGVYKGGSISPGIRMRLKAMNAFTGRLPLVGLADFDGLEGNDTPGSMLAGVVNGSVCEVEGMIRLYREQYADIQVLLCGGDANFFDSRLKSSIFAHSLKTEPDLVLIGLNEVILYNDKGL